MPLIVMPDISTLDPTGCVPAPHIAEAPRDLQYSPCCRNFFISELLLQQRVNLPARERHCDHAVAERMYRESLGVCKFAVALRPGGCEQDVIPHTALVHKRHHCTGFARRLKMSIRDNITKGGFAGLICLPENVGGSSAYYGVCQGRRQCLVLFDKRREVPGQELLLPVN